MTDLLPTHLPGLHTDQADYVSIRLNHELYVDKTPHFATLLAPKHSSHRGTPELQTKYVFLARPRRFGKSLLVSTLEAWFQGTHLHHQATQLHKPDELFAGTAGYNTWCSQPIRPVIRLDMSAVQGSAHDQVRGKLTSLLWGKYGQWHRRGVKVAYDPTIIRPDMSISPAEYLEHLIRCLQDHYGLNPAILIDEYDAPITYLIGKPSAEAHLEPVLDELHEFYGILKSAGDDLHFVFFTGVSRFGKVNLFSAINNMKDITEDPRYATLCGFTEQEVTKYLTPYLERIAHNIGWSLPTLRSYLQEYYNGYLFSVHQAGIELVYNPFTLLSSVDEWLLRDSDQAWREGQLTNHWSNSDTPDLLTRLIRRGKYTFPPEQPDLSCLARVSYNLDNLDYAALMLQTGYYTLRGGHSGDPLQLDYPNREVKDSYMLELWEYLHGAGAQWPKREQLDMMRRALEHRDYATFCERLLPLVARIPAEKLKEESDFHIILDVLSYVMQLECQSEVAVWGGRFDRAHEFQDHVCVMELKYNRSAQEALEQIKVRKYIDRFRDRRVSIVGLGLNFVKDDTAESPRIEHEVQTLYNPPSSP